jgi:hypothetical protein
MDARRVRPTAHGLSRSAVFRASDGLRTELDDALAFELSGGRGTRELVDQRFDRRHRASRINDPEIAHLSGLGQHSTFQ